MRFEPESAAEVFFNDCSADVAAAAVSRLSRQRMENLSESPTVVAWQSRPSTYVVCTDDNAVHPGLQRILARRADEVASWPTGHSPFLSRPDLVIDLLARVAAA